MIEYTLNSERFSNDYQPRSGTTAAYLDKAAEHRREGDKVMAGVWLDAAHRINDGSERPDRWTDAQARGESWAVRRMEAREHVAEARAEVRAVKSEAAAERGDSWAARYAARRMEAGQHVAEARAELRTVKEATVAEAPRKARAIAA